VPFLRPGLESLQNHVDAASKAFSLQDPSACVPPLIAGNTEVTKLIKDIESSQLSATTKRDLLTSLQTKQEHFQHAALEALGAFLELTVDPPGPPLGPSYFPRMEPTLSVAPRGQSSPLPPRLYNRGRVPFNLGVVALLSE